MIDTLRQSEMFYNYRRNGSAITGSILIGIFLFGIVAGPFLVAQDPYDIASLNLLDSYKPPVWL